MNLVKEGKKMSDAGPFSLIKLVDRDPLRVFYNGYNSVLIGIVFYILGAGVLPLLAFFSGPSSEAVILLVVGMVLVWMFPILVIAGFLMISAGLIVYITELHDRQLNKEKLEAEAPVKEENDMAAWGVKKIS
jgi:hypothetical protein